ncbi:hypothetical protein K523DRAFT_324891 [Schizophyllum commune Tattone D]|nr:hypothetical protein K523DRAFT_324891 [Schizophyllum commune Tattone D]
MSDAQFVPRTYGAILLGGLFSAWLGGMVTAQTVVYVKLYLKRDSIRLKSLVGAVWLLDALHSMAVWAAGWTYLIDCFGDTQGIAEIPWSIAMTVVFTASLTFLVHLFLARRIHLLSHGNYYLTAAVTILAVLRLASACVTTGTMIHYGNFADFKEHFSWVFTLGLALSSAVDALITGCLFVLLHRSRKSTPLSMPGLTDMIDTLILYAFESGSLTCFATIVSMICWITMNHNLIFLGLHFVIAKLYANTFLATLNMRYMIRESRSSSIGQPGIIVLERHDREADSLEQHRCKTLNALQISVDVQRTVQYDEETSSDRGGSK